MDAALRYDWSLDGEPDFDCTLASGGVEAFVVALEVGVEGA
jgi:hypothetical protein